MTSPASLDPDALANLEEERDFLLRSLEDLEREHDAGDLEDDDYVTLRDDYTVRAAETLRAIDEHRLAFVDDRPTSGRGRTIAVFGAVVVFAVIAGLVIAASIGSRDAGETSSGGITVRKSPSQRAQLCVAKLQELQTKGPAKAIACYKAVLDDDPKNVVALSWLGWTLELSTGLNGIPDAQVAELQSSASDLVERALKVNPDYSYALAFRAIMAYRHGDPAAAKKYLADFRAHQPSADAVQVIAQMDLDKNIDAALAAGSTTTSTAPSTTAPPG